MRHTNKITLILTSLLMIFTIVCTAWSSDVFVHGYYRSDGTFVSPHFRSAPNDTPWDNWSTYGNINPYTGKIGTKIPYTYNSYGSYDNTYRELENEIQQNNYYWPDTERGRYSTLPAIIHGDTTYLQKKMEEPEDYVNCPHN